MRALKTVLIILVALLAILVILGLTGPRNFRVERSVRIGASVDRVYEQVSQLARMREWGPWQALDKDQVQTIQGAADGTVGAVWTWRGDTVGAGSQEIIALDPGRSVRTKLVFTVPVLGDMVSYGTFDLQAEGDSTRLVWGMEGENGFVGRIMGVFGDAEGSLGPLFETGLATLKATLEAEKPAPVAPEAPVTAVTVSDRPAVLYLGARARVKWSELRNFCVESSGRALGILQAAGVQQAGPPSAVYFEWDEEHQEADLLAGIPVPAESKGLLRGMTLYRTPAGKALQVTHRGGHGGLGGVHAVLDARMKADGLGFNANVVEEYVTGPAEQPDSLQWVTNVIYLVK